jgi:hemolysin III
MKIKIKLREPMNGLTHFIGIMLAIIETILLLDLTLNPYRPYHFISFAIFGIGMILLFSISTLYHWIMISERATKILRKMDHIMIFIYIAATYTPICLIVFHESFGWTLLAVTWSIASIGIVIKLFWMNAPRWLSTIIYLLMGWLSVLIIYPLINALSVEALIWLLIGGIFYTIGAIIYALKKPDPFPGYLGFHEIFHLFVLLGTFSHFWLMYKFINLL